MPLNVPLLLLAGSILVVCLVNRSRTGKHFPPGPPRRFLIGNLLDIPQTVDTDLLISWKHKYGDMMYLKAFGYSILVLNSVDAVSDLLDKRSANFSNRPTMTMAGELMGLDQCIAMIEYGPKYKLLRKLIQPVLSATAIRKYQSMQQQAVAAYMRSLLHKPDQFLSELLFAVTRVILLVTYGISCEGAHDPYILAAEETMATIGKAMVPGAYVVDFIPFLKYLPRWVPGTGFLDDGKRGRDQIYNFATRPFMHVKSEMAAGTAPPSFVADLLRDKEALKMDIADDDIKWTAGTFYSAGVETTYATLASFIALMATHPEIQKRAQAELDSVVREDRLPDLGDKEKMPYIRAVILETMRWQTVTPLSLPRCTVKDDVYKGYFIPAQTLVIPNVWALSHGADGLENPDTFSPDRWLDEKTPDDPTYVFGFGRRSCPGRFMAEAAVFLLVTHLLAVFDITPSREDSVQLPKDIKFNHALVRCTEPYKCDIQPRSARRAEIIEDMASATNRL